VWWAGLARIVRSQVTAVKARAFMQAAVASGGTRWGIARRHVLPHVAGYTAIVATHDVASIILAVAGLSFLGLGAAPPAPEWGRMLFDAKAYLAVQPLTVLAPGLAIVVSVLGFNLLGDGLRDALDPAGDRSG
ncbi:MAG: ABC transporter permease, partial [Egibacteraceae bacterium]